MTGISARIWWKEVRDRGYLEGEVLLFRKSLKLSFYFSNSGCWLLTNTCVWPVGKWYPVTDVIGVTSSTCTSSKDNHQRWQNLTDQKKKKEVDFKIKILPLYFRVFCLGMVGSWFSGVRHYVTSKQIDMWFIEHQFEVGTVLRTIEEAEGKNAAVWRDVRFKSTSAL